MSETEPTSTIKRGFIYRFLLRWFVCSLGLWIAAGIISASVSYDSRLHVVVVAGLVLALINAIIKPILLLLSMPAILLTLGLFILIVNGLTVFIASKLYTPLHITNFGAAIVTGLIIGLVNYLVTAILEER